MKSGVKILNFTYKMLDLDQSIELTTNLWADSTFRNVWNKVEDWGSVAGMAIAVGSGAIGDDNDGQITGVMSGLGCGWPCKINRNYIRDK